MPENASFAGSSEGARYLTEGLAAKTRATVE